MLTADSAAGVGRVADGAAEAESVILLRAEGADGTGRGADGAAGAESAWVHRADGAAGVVGRADERCLVSGGHEARAG